MCEITLLTNMWPRAKYPLAIIDRLLTVYGSECCVPCYHLDLLSANISRYQQPRGGGLQTPAAGYEILFFFVCSLTLFKGSTLLLPKPSPSPHAAHWQALACRCLLLPTRRHHPINPHCIGCLPVSLHVLLVSGTPLCSFAHLQPPSAPLREEYVE